MRVFKTMKKNLTQPFINVHVLIFLLGPPKCPPIIVFHAICPLKKFLIQKAKTYHVFSAQKTKLSLYQEASLAESGGGKTGDGGGGLGDEKSRATLSRRSTNMSDQSASGSKQRVSSGGQGLTGWVKLLFNWSGDKISTWFYFETRI